MNGGAKEIRCEPPIFRKICHLLIRIKDEDQMNFDLGEGEF